MDSPGAHKGPKGPLRHRCAECSATGPDLFLCAGCDAVRYCSREHEAAHLAQHESACDKIKASRASVTKEEHRVRNGTTGRWAPPNAFDTHIGQFWTDQSTRYYMRARHSLAYESLLPLKTLDAVEECLEHMQDMLILNRTDGMGLKYIVPALLLRLDRDQECIDFIKWWWTCDLDGGRDWADMTLPHFDLCGTDILDDPQYLEDQFANLNHVVAILILKTKVLMDIRNIKVTRQVISSRLPPELCIVAEEAAIRSPLSAPFRKQQPEQLFETETTLLNHMRKLGELVAKTNAHYMRSLFNPDKALSVRPKPNSTGSLEEIAWEQMALSMHYTYAAWWETQGALELLIDARACAASDLEEEVLKVDEPGADKSLTQMWDYLRWAYLNACSLGPWSERPFERHSKREIRHVKDAAESSKQKKRLTNT
jgi:hypothetical protein